MAVEQRRNLCHQHFSLIMLGEVTSRKSTIAANSLSRPDAWGRAAASDSSDWREHRCNRQRVFNLETLSDALCHVRCVSAVFPVSRQGLLVRDGPDLRCHLYRTDNTEFGEAWLSSSAALACMRIESATKVERSQGGLVSVSCQGPVVPHTKHNYCQDATHPNPGSTSGTWLGCWQDLGHDVRLQRAVREDRGFAEAGWLRTLREGFGGLKTRRKGTFAVVLSGIQLLG